LGDNQRVDELLREYGNLIPCREDQNVFPTLWAGLDDSYESFIGPLISMAICPPSSPMVWAAYYSEDPFQWPETRMMIFSWAFFKLLDIGNFTNKKERWAIDYVLWRANKSADVARDKLSGRTEMRHLAGLGGKFVKDPLYHTQLRFFSSVT
jgi:hypothetical protein